MSINGKNNTSEHTGTIEDYKKALKEAGFFGSSIFQRIASIRTLTGEAVSCYHSQKAYKDYLHWQKTGETPKLVKKPKDQWTGLMPDELLEIELGELFNITNRPKKVDWIWDREVSYIGPSGAVWK